MSLEYTIISIGTLSQNNLWGETSPVRTSHATVTFIESDDKKILVDPSLPDKFLESVFFERTGKHLSCVTDVFCTTLRPVHRRGISALPNANWWANEPEIESYSQHLEGLQDSASRLSPDDEVNIRNDIDILRKFNPAPEKFTPQVNLYPLVGASVGSAGLLLTPPTSTVIIAADAVVTRQHYLSGQIWAGCSDPDEAKNSLQDIIEIADIIIPGHDNIMLSARNIF